MTGEQASKSEAPDQATIAFRRLLKDASTGDEARVDALIALSQRTIFAPVWPHAPDEIRTLTNSQGEVALPIFSAKDELRKAARRFAWFQVDGSLKYEELGARAALRQALARPVQYVVVDISADHAVEFVPAEIRPLLTAQPKRASTGPFAATGKLSSDLLTAVRGRAYSLRPLTMRPESVSNSTPPRRSRRPRLSKSSAVARGHVNNDSVVRQSSVPSPPAPPHAQRPPSVPIPAKASESEERAGSPSIEPEPPKLTQPVVPLSDILLQTINDGLRQFPEVDWACALDVTKDNGPVPAVALRVDPSVLTRVAAIKETVRLAAAAQQTALEVILLESAEVVRVARSVGNIFYPWRK
jgi:hypothetical protein